MEKNLLFDLYGTLINIHTNEESLLFWDSVKEELFIDSALSSEEIRNKYLEYCKKLSKEKEEIEILDVFKLLGFENKNEALMAAKRFRDLSTSFIKLYPRVKETLLELKSLGFKLYVLSNAQASFTLPELKKLGIYDLFDGIAISSDYGVKKPNQEFYKRAMLDFNISSGIMIGNDYECDILPAQALGLGAIFIKSNITPYEPNYWKKSDLAYFDKKLLINKIMEFYK